MAKKGGILMNKHKFTSDEIAKIFYEFDLPYALKTYIPQKQQLELNNRMIELDHKKSELKKQLLDSVSDYVQHSLEEQIKDINIKIEDIRTNIKEMNTYNDIYNYLMDAYYETSMLFPYGFEITHQKYSMNRQPKVFLRELSGRIPNLRNTYKTIENLEFLLVAVLAVYRIDYGMNYINQISAKLEESGMDIQSILGYPELILTEEQQNRIDRRILEKSK
jgi:hypothetical protein